MRRCLNDKVEFSIGSPVDRAPTCTTMCREYTNRCQVQKQASMSMNSKSQASSFNHLLHTLGRLGYNQKLHVSEYQYADLLHLYCTLFNILIYCRSYWKHSSFFLLMIETNIKPSVNQFYHAYQRLKKQFQSMSSCFLSILISSCRDVPVCTKTICNQSKSSNITGNLILFVNSNF